MHLTRFGVLLVSLALLGACATLRSKPRGPLDALNEEALVDYQKGRAKLARQKLMRSLSLAKDAGPGSKTSAARTRLYLGVVYAGALKQPGKAVEQMARALEEDPSLQLPAGVEKNLRVKRAFARAETKANRARTAAALQLDKEKPVERVVASNDAAAAEPPARGGKGRNKRGKEKRGAKVAAVVAPPPAETGPPPGAEADVPGTLPEMVFCPLPDEVPPGAAVKIWCAVDPSLKARALVIQVRPSGQTEFTALPVTRTGKGWYTATVDGAQVTGSMLQYFVEARGGGGGGMPLAATGDFDSPELLLIRDGAPVAPALLTNAHLEALEDGDDEAPVAASGAGGPPVAAAAVGEDNEDPFARDQPAAAPSTPSRFNLSDFWIGLQAGTGYGWHSGRAFELRTTLNAPGGFAPASSLHLLPEIGYRWSETINFSVQTRHQFIFHEGTAPGDSKPAVGAHSLILRASYRLLEREALTVAGTGSLGFGEGYRLVYGTDAAAGRSGTDTVRGGQALLGPGVLAAYVLTGKLSATAEVRLLFAFPDVAALAEFSAGLRYGL